MKTKVAIGQVLKTLTDPKEAPCKWLLLLLLPSASSPPRLLLPGHQVCKRAESEALACPQGRQISRGPCSGAGTRGQTVLLWPPARVRARLPVLLDLAGPDKLFELPAAARSRNSMFWLARHSSLKMNSCKCTPFCPAGGRLN